MLSEGVVSNRAGGGVCAFLQQMNLRGENIKLDIWGGIYNLNASQTRGGSATDSGAFLPLLPCFRVFAKGQNQDTRVMKVI
jgi:hypothetical protein